MKSSTHNPHLKAAYLEVVENQLRDNNPPETRQTLERLRTEGISEQDAKLLIASVIAAKTINDCQVNKNRVLSRDSLSNGL